MPSSADWRSPQYSDQFRSLDRAGMSFEFLRRNRAYRGDYLKMKRYLESGKAWAEAAVTGLSRRWGLAFPG